jgi:hypothetical protein
MLSRMHSHILWYLGWVFVSQAAAGESALSYMVCVGLSPPSAPAR